VKIIKLEQNYRSTDTILEAANALIKHNVRRRGKRLWSHKAREPGSFYRCSPTRMKKRERSSSKLTIYACLVARHGPARRSCFARMCSRGPLETALRLAGVRYHLVGAQSFFDRREVRDFLAYLKAFVNPDERCQPVAIANVPPRGLSDVTMERLLWPATKGIARVCRDEKYGDRGHVSD